MPWMKKKDCLISCASLPCTGNYIPVKNTEIFGKDYGLSRKKYP